MATISRLLNMSFEILTSELLVEFTLRLNESPVSKLNRIKKPELPVDYFQFYKSVSSVYSSKIEGEEIDFDSYFKHKFMKVKFKSDSTKKADDLYAAYEFIDNNKLTLENVKKAYASMIHLVFVKIHPFQDGNGRTARLIEKWFLLEKLGESANVIHLEKNYWQKLNEYYNILRNLALNMKNLTSRKALIFY